MFEGEIILPLEFNDENVRKIMSNKEITHTERKQQLNKLMYEYLGGYNPDKDDLEVYVRGEETTDEWNYSTRSIYNNRTVIAKLIADCINEINHNIDYGGEPLLPLADIGRELMTFYINNLEENQKICANFRIYIWAFFKDYYELERLVKINFPSITDEKQQNLIRTIVDCIKKMEKGKNFIRVCEEIFGTVETPIVDLAEEEKKQKEEEEKKQKEEEEKKQKEEEKKQKEEEEKKQKEEEKKQKEEEKKQKEVKQKEEAKKQEDPSWGWNGVTFTLPSLNELENDDTVTKVYTELLTNQNVSNVQALNGLHSLQYNIFGQIVPEEVFDNMELEFNSFLTDKDTSNEEKQQTYERLVTFFLDAIKFCIIIRKGFNDFNKKYSSLNLDIKKIGNIIIQVLQNRYGNGDMKDLTDISANFFLEYDVYFQKVLKTLGSYPDLATPAARYEEVKRRFYFVDPKLGNIFEYYLNNYNLTGRSFSKFLDYLNTVIYQEAKKDGNYSTIPQTMAQKDAQDGDKLAKGYAEYYEIKKSILYWVEKDKERLKGWNNDKIDEYANFFHDTFLSSEVHERINEFFTNIIKYGVGVPDVLKPDEITELTNLLIEKRQKLGKEVDAVEAKNEIVKDYLSQYLKYDHIVNAINADFALEVKTNTNDVKKIIQQILSEKNGISPSESEVEKYFQESSSQNNIR